MLKGGNREALDLHGFNPDNKAVVDRLKIPSSVRIGEPLSFEFSFVNRERRAALFRLEYAIDYLTATGKTSCKIFRITESRYPPGKRVLIQRKRSFKNLSTRKHHQGNHRLTVIVNGKKLASSEFLVA